jgi:hypothetical protein
MRSARAKFDFPFQLINHPQVYAAIAGALVGLAVGMIDVHSAGNQWLNPLLGFLIAGCLIGSVYGVNAWPAWVPLGWCVYLVHRVAIARGYRPPYVEASADEALQSLFVLWPAGLGIALGALGRYAAAGIYLFNPWAFGPKTRDFSNARNRETGHAGESEVPPVPSLPSATPQQPRGRLTVARLMVLVAVVGVHLATVRVLLMREPFFGMGTVYSEGYSDGRFSKLVIGMSAAEVESIMGRPLRKVPWDVNSSPPKTEMWFFSDQPTGMANYHRRWVRFENGQVTEVINEFWYD